MQSVQELKDYLVNGETISRGDLAKAEMYASKQKVSFQKALHALDLITNSDLGRSLSDIYEMPYRELLAPPPSDSTKSLLSVQCVSRWKVFPVDYNSVTHVLTLAVHHPDQIPMMDHIFKFLMQPYALTFTIAPQSEIEEAIEVHLETPASEDQPAEPAETASPREPEKKPEPLKLSGLHKAMSARAETRSTVPDLSSFLVNAVSLLVGNELEDNLDKLAAVRVRVRYCQLLASRLHSSPPDVEQITLAAWLSGIDDKPDIIKRLVPPEELHEILFPGDKPSEKGLVLSLVKCFQDLKTRDPSACKDVNLTRRNLRLLWSSSPKQQDMLEAFLQLLMDEEFLAKLDRAAGRILIIDPSEMTTSGMGPPLIHDGYEVHVVPTVEAADNFVADTVPDLVIAATYLLQESALKFCRKLKQQSSTEHVPFLAIIPERSEKLAAESLRAGADDFLTKPVDLEILFLKIQKLIRIPQNEATTTGVSGSLKDMSFTDMIQILCAGNKSMEILLSAEGEKGHVFVKSGEIIHAGIGNLQGEDAFYQLMRWKTGEFTTKQCAQFPDRSIQVSAMALLMEGARLMDDEGADDSE